MIRAEFKYRCADCGTTTDIINCFDGHLTYDLCLDCFLEREHEQKNQVNDSDDYDAWERFEQIEAMKRGTL